jgi:hypothetical protein
MYIVNIINGSENIMMIYDNYESINNMHEKYPDTEYSVLEIQNGTILGSGSHSGLVGTKVFSGSFKNLKKFCTDKIPNIKDILKTGYYTINDKRYKLINYEPGLIDITGTWSQVPDSVSIYENPIHDSYSNKYDPKEFYRVFDFDIQRTSGPPSGYPDDISGEYTCVNLVHKFHRHGYVKEHKKTTFIICYQALKGSALMTQTL